MDKHRLKDGTSGDGPEREGVLVGFELPTTVSASTASVCGDFNGWRAEAHPLSRVDDGPFRTEIVLSAGERYRFRYLLDGQRWENDPAADDFVPNGLGSDDSVVDLTDIQSLPVIDANTAAAAAAAAASRVPTEPAEEDQAAPTTSPDGDGVVRLQLQPGLQRVRLRLQTWERIEVEAAARGIASQDFIADLLEAALSSRGWPTIEPLTHRK